MTIDPVVILTILAMAVVTYATRIGGFLLLSKSMLEGRTGILLHYVPGAVLIAIVAPSVLPLNLWHRGWRIGGVSRGPAEAIAAVVTAAITKRYKNLLVAMLVGVATVWLLKKSLRLTFIGELTPIQKKQ